MKTIEIPHKEKWLEFIVDESRYQLPKEAKGGVWVDCGCNFGGFIRNYSNWPDKYVGYDVWDENVSITQQFLEDSGIKGEAQKRAVWSSSGKTIKVYGYERWDEEGLSYFGNSGNIGTVPFVDERGGGWKEENQIGTAKSISLADIKKEWGKIKVLKVDIEGAEYEFLLGKDLSGIEYIVLEFHLEEEKKEKLHNWISKTHTLVHNQYFTLYQLGLYQIEDEETNTNNSTEELEENNSTAVSGSTK